MVEIKIQVGKTKSTGLLGKITQFIFGVFLTSVIFALYMKLWQETGIIFAFATCFIISFLAYYQSEPATFIRRVMWGMVSTVITIIVSYFVLMQIFTSALEGL